MIPKEDIGAKVKEFIDSAFGSQMEAGRRLGLHATTLGGAIKGRWLPSEKVLRAMKLERVDIRDASGKVVDIIYEEEWEVKLRKFNQLYRGMTTISKKIYEAVPPTGEMSLQQIVTEIGKTGSAQFAVIEACLNQMRESGLLHRNGKGEYSREPVEAPATEVLPSIPKEPETQPSLPEVKPEKQVMAIPEPISINPPAPEETMKPIETVSNIPPSIAKTPFDIMAELSERANTLRVEMEVATAVLQKAVNDFGRLTDDIDNATIAIQEQFEADAAELNQLRDLKSTLKKFMG